LSTWQTTLAEGAHTVLIAGEPGVGKTRLAGEWSQRAYEQGAVVLYGRCDEDLGAPYQPFAEALRSLVPCLGASRLRGLRGVEALLSLVPRLTDVLPDLLTAVRADSDTERFALFDAVVGLLELASAAAPVVLILDDLHWAAKPTLLLLRHLLRFGDRARVQIVGTYRSTDLDRSHPLAAMLADLHRDGTADRLNLSGLDGDDVTAYVAEAGYDDEELANALASVTGGNPFFLIEALRHVDESGGVWDQSTLPQGVREAVSRRLSRLPAETNRALAAAAVVGSRFAVDLVEQVVGDDLVDAFDEAAKAGIVIEEPGGYYRFNHALVRQSLLAELASVRRMRLHQRIATTLETRPGADDELLAELAYHYFECAWAGNAAKAVEYCRRAADQAMARLAYEGAADFFDRALHALDEIDDELPDRDEQVAELLIARCEALLAAGDVASAGGAVSQLRDATLNSPRLAAWAACFDGQLSMLIHPERLDEAETAVSAAANKLAELDDAAGEAKAHTVHATCLARLGRIADCEIALDDALTAARRARDHRLVNAVLANAPLAALWGPNPVPRAGGRCLDVVRLLRITTDSPAVEAMSTRCQAVLEAFRGRAAAARRMIDSARRAVSELGLRHALLEVEQFAGIVELVVDEPAAAEPHLRKAYNGFRRMGLDADTAESAALLGCACLVLGRESEADELCTESERLAGHALKASIAWRTLRARLLSLANDHQEARRVAEAAVVRAERTDALVDHGDACLTLGTVLGAAGDVAGARVAAERAVDLYERKGAAALAEKARRVLGAEPPPAPSQPEAPAVELDTACIRVGERVMSVINSEAWDELDQLFAADVVVESRRKIVGLALPSDAVRRGLRRELETGALRVSHVMIAARGERLALSRLIVGTADATPGAPQDELLQLYGIDEEGRVSLQVWFDVDDMDAALAELDARYARLQEENHRVSLENVATRVYKRLLEYFVARDWDAASGILADCISTEDRRRVVNAGVRQGRSAVIAEITGLAEMGIQKPTSDTIATRGERLVLSRARSMGGSHRPEAYQLELLHVVEIDADETVTAIVVFELEDIDAAIAELDARYLAGEAAVHAHIWSAVMGCYAAVNRHELPATTTDFVDIDHRRGTTPFAPGEVKAYTRAAWSQTPDISFRIEAVHRLSDRGAVVTHAIRGTSREGFEAEWREVPLMTLEGDLFNRSEFFDEADVDAALARLEELSRPPSRRLENTASKLYEQFKVFYAARDWSAVSGLLADNILSEDRRRPINSGVRHGPEALIAEISALAEVGIDLTTEVVATRGERLVLSRIRTFGHDQGPDGFGSVALDVLELGLDGRFVARIVFNSDDFEAAIAEIDARYLAGEAAAHAHTWSVIREAYAGFNRRDLRATTPDWVSIDNRRGAAFAPGDIIAYIQAAWDDSPDTKIYIAAVNRLSNVGAVVTHVAHGISQGGFDAEWRDVFLLAVEGKLVNRGELFDDADLETAIARFNQLSRPAPRLENAASQAVERYVADFSARDWDALAKVLADNVITDDRRRAANAGIRHGRDAEVVNLRESADAGVTHMTSGVIAVRGERLILTHASGFYRSEEFFTDMLAVVETNSDNQMAAVILFDLDDFDSAIAELDARYLTGEAAAYARTWSVIASGIATVNRHELPPMSPDCVSIDHRRVAAFGPGEGIEYLRAGWELGQDVRTYVEVVHRLTDLGAVYTHAGHGVSREGLDAEWRGVDLLTVNGDMVNRCEIFDEADLDAAVAKFEQLSQSAPRLENAASQAVERYLAGFAARDWDALANVLANDIVKDDRRRIVNEGVRHGRDAEVANMRMVADAGAIYMTFSIIAVRGERLILAHASGLYRSEEFLTDMLAVVEINFDNQIAAIVIFDLDDFDSAIVELDARYLTGEAAPYCNVWSVVAGSYAALNRHQVPLTTPDCVNVDHRHETAFGPGDVTAYIEAGAWDVDQDISIYVEQIHRLSGVGAVVTYSAHETSQDGLKAEWRGIAVFTVAGEMVNGTEVFDEADLEAALMRFDELSRPSPRLQTAASQAYERFQRCFAAGNWDALADMLADNFSQDDRRRVVGAGLRRGRDAQLADAQAFADIGVKESTATIIATRGERLVLCRSCIYREDQQAGEIRIEFLSVIEIAADERILARIAFDPDDFDAAFEELDRRYLAGEVAAHAHTWSIITQGYAALNRQEFPLTTPDWLNIDHRRGAGFAPGDAFAYLRAGWDLGQHFSTHVECVHRLDTVGAVVTHRAHGSSQEGFDAEWREIAILTVDGDAISGGEVFDEADIDAALARFDQLSPPAPQLKNAASQTYQRMLEYFAARDWKSITEKVVEDFVLDDRRRGVNAGIRHGRDAEIQDLQAIADIGVDTTADIIATRGENLALTHTRFSGLGQQAQPFLVEVLGIVEVNSDWLIVSRVDIDIDDVDAAFAELDARYLAGEAAAHSHIWSVIASSYAAFNRHVVPATDWVTVDHRRGTPFEPSNMTPSIRTIWDLTPDLSIHIEAVHRLNDSAVLITHHGRGTSKDGFDAEWRAIDLLIVEEGRIDRCEIFDEADLDAALACFDEISPPARRPETLVSQVARRFSATFAARDWDAMAQILAADISVDDRRRGINAGVRRGWEAAIEDLRASVDAGFANATVTVIATRGERLALTRFHVSEREQRPQAFQVEVLHVFEINADSQTAAVVVFDLHDVDAAFAELDTRYLAGEAAAYAHTWSVIAEAHAAFNRHEIFTMAPDLASIDHRRVVAFAPGEFVPYVQATLDVAPYAKHHIDVVHRLSNLGVLVTQGTYGTSQEGFDAEWREIALLTVDGDLINRCEIFDEEDLDAALARFDELSRPAPLENMASQVAERYWKCFCARDWAALAQIVTEDFVNDDRRRVVGAGSQEGSKAVIADMRVIADLWIGNVTTTVIATRGQRLALMRIGFSSRDHGSEAFVSEVLGIGEINTDERLVAAISFDSDDLEVALAELDSRYLAGEAALYSDVWSVITQGYAALNRHEHPATTTDWVNVDHRRGRAFPPGDLPAYLDASWELMPDASLYIAAVHQLSNVGAVVRQVVHGRTREGFDAEWGEINVLKAAGDRVSRCELFDEEDFDAALSTFAEWSPQTRRLENTASKVYEHFFASYASQDWAALAKTLSDNGFLDDRRRAVDAGIWSGRDVFVENLRATADFGLENLGPIATRGQHLFLGRFRWSANNHGPEMFHTDAFCLQGIDADEQIQGFIVFDVNEMDAAFAELDARYVAGEAAPYAQTWSIISGTYAAMNRRELFPTTPDWVNVDHRRPGIMDGGDLHDSLRSLWQLTTDLTFRIEAVHRLTHLGSVCSHVAHGVSRDGFDAEWRGIELLTVDDHRINRCEIFDEEDLDAALARFDELQPRQRRVENAASRAHDRFFACARARNWAPMAGILDDNSSVHDRRRVVNIGVWDGRDVLIANFRALADALADVTSTAIATRGERLVLTRISAPNRDPQHGDFGLEMLGIAELDTNGRLAAHVLFDVDDIDAAFAELDARYLAGEAVAHAPIWSVIAGAYTRFNRRELPATTPEPVYIDHRPLVSIEGVDLAASFRALWGLTSEVNAYIEAVHRLSERGAVITQVLKGTWQEGSDAELSMIGVFTVEGDLISRAEVFDETDLDAALARFEELQPLAPRLENLASEVEQRVGVCFAARDWDALAALLSDDFLMVDRRRVVNAGVQHGRDAEIASQRAIAGVGVTEMAQTVIAIRGRRLVLGCYSIADGWSGSKALCVSEINAENQLATRVAFDPDDIEAAFAELDARYLAGEAAGHAHTWSAIMGAFAALNRHEVFGTTPDWIHIDRRLLASFEAGDLAAYLRATWDVTPDIKMYVEAVHQLSDVGAVLTHAAEGTSPDGFHAEWRMVLLLTVDGDLINRGEIFDEENLDSALARFDELDRPAPRLENAATRTWALSIDAFNRRDMADYLALMTTDGRMEDRRKGLGGLFNGPSRRKAVHALFEEPPESWRLSMEPIAIRGSRLSMTRECCRDTDAPQQPITVELLTVMEVDDDGLIHQTVSFDPDDIDAAFKELEARYLASDAAAHAQTWSAVLQAYTAVNQQHLPATTKDWVTVDHRRGRAFTPGQLEPYLHAVWDVTPGVTTHIEAVHRLTSLGAVVTHTAAATSSEGFDAEWREITVSTVEGELISRSELFDETDLEAALARFDELDQQRLIQS
jgi:tetratricopeptide (TPR) repeat protein